MSDKPKCRECGEPYVSHGGVAWLCRERRILQKRLDAISEVCALASVGERGQNELQRVLELHAELGHQIDRANAMESAARAVLAFDWSDSDADAVAAIERLRAAVRPATPEAPAP